MKNFHVFRDGFVGPIVILLSICLFVTWAMAATYTVTEPIIAEAEVASANDARKEVLKAADSFTEYAPERFELPEGVETAHQADNGAGFVFRAAAKGFNGEVPFMIGLDKDGNVTGVKMLDNGETPGLGSKVGTAAHVEQYYGSRDVDSVAAISGATRTSNALKNSLRAAFEAYELLKDQQPS